MQFFGQLEAYPLPGYHHLFDLGDLIWLLVIFVGIISLVRLYMKFDQIKRRKLVLWLTGSLMVYRVLVLVSSIVLHGFWVQWIPLQICPLMMIVAFVYALKPNRFAGAVLFTMGVTSPAMAILFPDWLMAPYFNFYSIGSYLSHGILIAVVMMWLRSGEIKPKIQEIWMPMLFVLIGLPIATFANHHLAMNFWMIAKPSVGSPLVGIYNQVGGEFYVPTLMLMEVIFWVLLYTFYNANQNKIQITAQLDK